MREQLGQSSTLAALGGLRSLVSIYITLHAHDAWQMTDWETVERDYQLITTLAPRDIDNFIRGAWHMWANASANYELNESIPTGLREKMRQTYIDKGIAILEQGIHNNPGSGKALGRTRFCAAGKKEGLLCRG